MQAVIIAGGKGRRLQPFTTTVPKPLFPVGNKAIIEIILDQLRQAGITDIIVSIGYLGGLIEAYLGNGARLDCTIAYVREKDLLGTAGPIGLLPAMSEDFILMNGDILASLDFQAAIRDHKAASAIMTICTYRKYLKSSLGILEIDGANNVRNYLEKPEQTQIVSTGIYVFHPRIRDYVGVGERLDIPDLVLRLIRDGQIVKAWPINGPWFDIGTPEDLEMAIKFYETNLL